MGASWRTSRLGELGIVVIGGPQEWSQAGPLLQGKREPVFAHVVVRHSHMHMQVGKCLSSSRAIIRHS